MLGFAELLLKYLPKTRGPSRHYETFTATLTCAKCGAAVPLRGPVRALRCACGTETKLTAERLAEYLHYTTMGATELEGQVTWTHPAAHPCPKCGAAVDLEAIPVGTESSTPCAKCGAAIVAFPPPPWLAEELPTLVQLYGAAREGEDVPPQDAPTTPWTFAHDGPLLTRAQLQGQ